MPAVKQKDGTWKWKSKDGTLGKRNFKTQKAAQSQGRAPKAKGTGSKKGGKSKAVAKKDDPAPPAKPPKIGSAYTAGKASAMLLSPITDTVLEGLRSGDSREKVLKDTADKILSLPYAYNLAVLAVDAGIDRKTAQATALTMGSGTAILPELYLASIAFDQLSGEGGKLSSAGAAQRLHRRVVVAHQGYNPSTNTIEIAHPEFRTYRTLKHGGQALRMLRGKSGIVKRITAPLAKLAKVFGGRV